MKLSLKEINASFLTQPPDRKIFIIWFEDGRRRMKTTGTTVSKEAKKRHEEWKDEQKKLLQEYETGEAEKNKFKPRMFSDFSKKYLELSEPPTKTIKTYQSIKCAVNEFLRVAGDKPIHHYELEDLDTFLKRKIKEASEFTARKYKIDLKAIFNMAIKYNHLKINLWQQTLKVNPKFDEIDFFEKEEFREFLNVIDNELYKNIYMFYALSGLRREELVNQKVENILLDRNLIKIENDYGVKQVGEFKTVEFTTKNQKYRFVELNKLLIPIVKLAEANKQIYIFERAPGKKMNSQMISKMFKRYLTKTKLNQSLHLHDLRHTYAVWMLRLTKNMKYVSQQLGHQSMDTTEKFYAKYNPEKNMGYNKLKL